MSKQPEGPAKPARRAVGFMRETLALAASPLAHRVALTIFLAILIVEALILLPSTLRKEDDLVRQLVGVGGEVLHTSRNMPALSGDPAGFAAAILSADVVAGARITDEGGNELASSGEPLTMAGMADAPRNLDGPVVLPRSADGTRVEVVWPAGQVSDRWTIALRLDSSEVSSEVWAFVFRIAGLVVLIAVALTLASLMAVGSVLLRPLIRLRDALREGGDVEWGGRVGPNIQRKDEIGEVYRAIADLLEELGGARVELQERVRERTALLHDAIENASGGFILYDADGKVLIYNHHYQDYFGYSDDDLKEGVTAKDLDALDAQRGWFLRDGDGRLGNRSNDTGDYEGQTPDGRWLFVRRRPTSTGGVVAIQVDITERREHERRVSDLLNALPNPLVVSDIRTGVILFANTHAQRLYGTKVGGTPVVDVYRNPEKRDELVSILRETGAVDDFEAEITDGDGGWNWVLMSARMMVFKGAEAVLVASQIITDRKRAEQILAEEKERAEELSRKKSEFIAVISHEVRTPMNGVLGMARLLLESDMTEEQTDFASTILRSGESLLTILNDLLDISKLEAGKLDLEKIAFSPKSIVEDAVGLMTSRAEEKGVSLVVDMDDALPQALRGDPNRLRQILLNLLSNAVKFTPAGAITVSLKSMPEDGRARLTMGVADTGVGIRPDVQSRLFSPYSQASAEVARKYGGTGLGLNICRRLATLMGGEISLDSAVGEGSTFTFTARFDEAAAQDIPESVKISVDGRSDLAVLAPFRILLVEDNEINRRVAIGMLSRQGHAVEVAEDGQMALMTLRRMTPDIILMDRHMPNMNGLDATRRIRAMDGPVASLPIIGVTAAANAEEIGACLEAGMNDVVTKPIHPAALAKALAQFSRSRCIPSSPELMDPVEDDLPEPAALEGDVLDRAVAGVIALRGDCGDDVADMLIEKFLARAEDAPRYLAGLDQAEDIETVRRTVHDLKSNAATLGLAVLAGKFRRLERACLSDDRSEIRRRIGTLPDQLDLSLPILRQAMK